MTQTMCNKCTHLREKMDMHLAKLVEELTTVVEKYHQHLDRNTPVCWLPEHCLECTLLGEEISTLTGKIALLNELLGE